MTRIRSRWLVIVGSVLASGIVSLAQTPQPRFDVVSVKPANPGDPIFGLHIQPGRFSVTNATLEMLIGFAYALPNSQVSGVPPWAQSESFTIEATIDTAAPVAADNAGVSSVMSMLQPLLMERFRLSAHKEIRQVPVYELAVANNGPKLTRSEDSQPPGRRMGRGQLTGNMPIPLLATSLSQWVDRPVIDKTGLRGNYKVDLKYSPELGQGERFGPDQQTTSSDAPSLFTALREQLGLELKAGRGPVEVLVVDRVARPDVN